MIAVNINKSGASAVTSQQIQEAAVGEWVVSDEALTKYGDLLMAVRKNTVLGIWKIIGWHRNPAGRVSFDVAEAAEEKELVGGPSPAIWIQGQANPIKLVDTDTGQPEASSVQVTRQGNRKVVLDGWTFVVYPDGRARVQSPNSEQRLIVESAFPGPKGGNVTVRLMT